MKWTVWSLVTLGALVLALMAMGCDDGNGDDPPSRFVTVDALSGTWLRESTWGTERTEFGVNMTVVFTVSDELGTDTWDGAFEITEGGRLVTTVEGSSFDENVTETWSIIDQAIPAVIGDRYHPSVLHRTEGLGAALDGSWAFIESNLEEVIIDDAGDITTESDEYLVTVELTIEGDQVDMRTEETQIVDGDNYFDTERLIGTLRIDGEQIWVTYTESDTSPIPEDDQEEEFFGWKLSENVIDITTLASGDPADLAFNRQ